MPQFHSKLHDDLALSDFAHHQCFLTQKLFVDDLHDFVNKRMVATVELVNGASSLKVDLS